MANVPNAKPEFVEYTQPETGFKTLAHVVTEDTAGEYVLSTSSQSQYVAPGNVLVPGSRPDQYEAVSAKDWDAMSMVGGPDPVDEDDPEDDLDG